jgi:hypothetical protein
MGKIHINGVEKPLVLKRGLRGAYVHAASFNLFRYLDERMFSFNERGPGRPWPVPRHGGHCRRASAHLRGVDP